MADRELVVHTLRELVEALDRRVAHVERLGETRIASEAAALRKDAVNRIRELTAAPSHHDTRETERSGEVMTDDGGPLKKEECGSPMRPIGARLPSST
jgi:hypothetical protein